jgi:hypothetical protein
MDYLFKGNMRWQEKTKRQRKSPSLSLTKMAPQKLTNCCAITELVVIVSLLRRTYETLHATSLQRESRALYLVLFAW